MIRRRHRRRTAQGANDPRLKLTSMMDILTTLLLFLLKAFVVEGEAANPPADVQLPESSSEQTLQASVTVAISKEMILVSGQPVVSVPDAIADEDLLLEGLDDRLVAARDQMEHLAELRGAAPPDPKVTIQGDREIEFRLLEKVMFTCGEAGYDQLALAVVQGS